MQPHNLVVARLGGYAVARLQSFAVMLLQGCAVMQLQSWAVELIYHNTLRFCGCKVAQLQNIVYLCRQLQRAQPHSYIVA
jgi:hypothetical protein